MKKAKLIIILSLTISLLAGCVPSAVTETSSSSFSVSNSTAPSNTDATSESSSPDTIATEAKSVNNSDTDATTIRLITTSDIHGKMVPWLYSENHENPSGSLAQIATIVKEKKNDNTILIDVGDNIQDNSAELFLDEEVHPMIQGMNAIGYDISTMGNHEFNYGIDTTKKTIASLKSKVILCNVYDAEGKRLADPYVIKECGGIRIGFIGAVSPNIVNWDRTKLKDCTVAKPADEINKIIDEIEDKTDLLVGVLHMDTTNELGTEGSGVSDVIKQCPELDFVCAGHGHRELSDENIEGVPVVENKSFGQTVMVSDINMKKQNGKWAIENTVTESVHSSEYESDKEITELLSPYDKIAKEDAEKVIGNLVDGDLPDDSDIPGIPNKFIKDTALMDFKAYVFKHYSGADVVVTAVNKLDEGLKQGEIRKYDVSNLQKFANELYLLKMTGKQLKQLMKWNVAFYKQSKPGDLTVAFSEERPIFTFLTFTGVNYEVNISKPAGERIENLTWSDGRPVKDNDVFKVAVHDYFVNAYLSAPGEVYKDTDALPELITADASGGVGNQRDVIIDYIANVKNGEVTPIIDNNWKLTGINTDEETTKKIRKLVEEGKLKIESSKDGRKINFKAITEEMLKKAR